MFEFCNVDLTLDISFQRALSRPRNLQSETLSSASVTEMCLNLRQSLQSAVRRRASVSSPFLFPPTTPHTVARWCPSCISCVMRYERARCSVAGVGVGYALSKNSARQSLTSGEKSWKLLCSSLLRHDIDLVSQDVKIATHFAIPLTGNNGCIIKDESYLAISSANVPKWSRSELVLPSHEVMRPILPAAARNGSLQVQRQGNWSGTDIAKMTYPHSPKWICQLVFLIKCEIKPIYSAFFSELRIRLKNWCVLELHYVTTLEFGVHFIFAKIRAWQFGHKSWKSRKRDIGYPSDLQSQVQLGCQQRLDWSKDGDTETSGAVLRHLWTTQYLLPSIDNTI